MPHVFISTHFQQAQLAFNISAQVEELGFEVALNPLPDAGATWQPWLEHALREAWSVITILSPEAVESAVCMAEWAFAWGAKLPVIPVVATPKIEEHLHPYLIKQGLVGADQRDELAGRLKAAATDALAMAGVPEQSVSELVTASDLAGLVAMLDNPVYPAARAEAAQALGASGRADWLPEMVTALCAALGDPVDAVREAVVNELARIGAEAVPALQQSVVGEDRIARRGAVLALARIGGATAVPGLIAALGVRDWHVPRTAALTLGRIGDVRAVDALRAAAGAEDEHLRALAQAAVEQIERVGN